MTIPTIQRRLLRIAAEAKRGDFERAHSLEIELFVEVLRAVAEGKAGAVEAGECLRSLELRFIRATA